MGDENQTMNEKFIIRGGTPLKGSVQVSGAKNAAVAILPATILAEGRCVIENLPVIDDVLILLKILKYMGAEVQLKGDVAVVDTSALAMSSVRINLAKRLRAS